MVRDVRGDGREVYSDDVAIAHNEMIEYAPHRWMNAKKLCSDCSRATTLTQSSDLEAVKLGLDVGGRANAMFPRRLEWPNFVEGRFQFPPLCFHFKHG